MQTTITLAQAIGLSVAGAAIVAVSVFATFSTAYKRGCDKGWSDGFFAREIENKKRRDRAGRYRTMEAE